MAIQQVLAAQSVGTTGNGLPPNTYAGLTFWMDGDDTSRFFQNQPATTPATTDGQMVARVNSSSPTTRCMAGAGGVLKVPTGYRYLNLPPNAGVYEYFNHSPSGVAPTTFATLANLVVAAQHVVIYLIRINDSNPDSGSTFNNDPLFYDLNGGYMFGATYKSAGKGFVDTYVEASGGARVVSGPLDLGQWYVVTWQHTGGVSRVRVNGGAWTSVTCGNIASLTGSPINFCRTPPVRNVDIAQHCIYNAARTPAELLEVERFFGKKVGITI